MGLSILSLNQFAEHMAQAEALSAEVVIILKGLQGIEISRAGAESTSSKAEGRLENAVTTSSQHPCPYLNYEGSSLEAYTIRRVADLYPALCACYGMKSHSTTLDSHD